MKKIIRELTLFVTFCYLSIWIGFAVLFILDLRSASAAVTYIEEVFLVQLSMVVWFLSLIILYILRIIFSFLDKKFNHDAGEGGP
jgi:hypothetical protein